MLFLSGPLVFLEGVSRWIPWFGVEFEFGVEVEVGVEIWLSNWESIEFLFILFESRFFTKKSSVKGGKLLFFCSYFFFNSFIAGSFIIEKKEEKNTWDLKKLDIEEIGLLVFSKKKEKDK